MFATKLLALGPAAATMLDKEMQAKNVNLSEGAMKALGLSGPQMEKGVAASTARLTQLVKADLDVALDEISKMVIKGQLSFDTMAKMFGQRNVGQISQMLYMLGGDIGEFKRQLLTMRNVEKDASVAMESWAASLEKLNNSFTRSQASFNSFLDTTGKDMLDLFSSLLNIISDVGEKSPGVMLGLTAGVATFYKTTSFFIMKAQGETSKFAKTMESIRYIIPQLFSPLGLAIGASAAALGILLTSFVNIRKAEQRRINDAKKADKEIAKTLTNIYYANKTREKLISGIDTQLNNEIKNWGRLNDVIQVTDRTMKKFYGGLDLSKVAIDVSKFKIGNIEDTRERDAMLELQKREEKKVKSLEEQDNVDSEIIKKEKRKLDIVKKINKFEDEKTKKIKEQLKLIEKYTKSGKSPEIIKAEKQKLTSFKQEKPDISSINYLNYIRARNEHAQTKEMEKATKADFDRGKATSKQYSVSIEENKLAEKKEINAFETLKNNMSDSMKTMFEQGYITQDEIMEDIKMSTEDFRRKYDKRIKQNMREITLKGANMEDYTSELDKNKAFLVYVKEHEEMAKISKSYSEIIDESIEIQNKNMIDMKNAYDTGMSQMAATRKVLDQNILNYKKTLLNKSSIKNMEDFKTNVNKIYGKETTDDIIDTLNKAGIVKEADQLQYLGGGKNVQIIEKIKSSNKINEELIKTQNALESNLSQLYSPKELKQQASLFDNAKTDEEREEIVKNLVEEKNLTGRAKTQVERNLSLLFQTTNVLRLRKKDLELYLKAESELSKRAITISEFQIKQDLKTKQDYLINLNKANDKSVKLKIEENQIGKEKGLLLKKSILYEKQKNKIEERIYQDAQKSSMIDSYKKIGIDPTKGKESFLKQIKQFSEKGFQYLDSDIATAAIKDMNEIKASTNRIRENALEKTRLDNRELELQRERIELSKQINFDMYEQSGKIAKLQLQANNASFGGGIFEFSGSAKYSESEIDKNTIDEKIQYLQNLKSRNSIEVNKQEIEKEIMNLKLESYQIELEQYKTRKKAISDVANLAINSLTTGLTTGEIPKVDNSKLMSGFGNLMGTIFSGQAPKVDIEQQQLDKLTEIANNTKISESVSKSISSGEKNPSNIVSGLFGANLMSKEFKEKFSGAKGIGAKFDVIKGGIGSSFKNFASSWKGTNKKELNFSSSDKLKMGAQAAGAAIGMLNSFTANEAKMKVSQLKAEGDILQMRLQGAHTEEEKKEIEDQIYENKKRQIRAEYKSKTQFMGISGTSGAALKGAMSGAMTGAAVGGAPGAVVGGVMGLASGWMGGNKAKQQAKQQEAALKVQRDIKKLNEDRNKMLKANNTFMGTFGKYANKIGINEGIKAGFKSIQDVGAMAIGGSGIDTWTQSHGHGKKKYKTQESVQKTVSLADIGIDRNEFDTLEETLIAIEKTKEKIAFWERQGSHSAKATTKAYKNMLKNLENIADVHKSNIEVYKSYFGAKLDEQKDGDYITGFTANWNDFRSEMLKMSSTQALAGMDAQVSKLTNNFFNGISDAFVQNMTGLNDIISNNIIKAYETIAKSIEGKKVIDKDDLIGPMGDLIIGIQKYKTEQDKVNKTITIFENTWVEAGGNISDILESATQATKDLYSALFKSVQSGSKSGLEDLISSDIIKSLESKNINNALDKLGEQIINISKAAQDSSSIGNVSNAIDNYLKLSDALGDVERYKEVLINMGLGDEEIKSLLYQVKLQEKLNSELEKRMTLDELLNKQKTDFNNSMKKYYTDQSKINNEIIQLQKDITSDRNHFTLEELDEKKSRLDFLKKDSEYISNEFKKEIEELENVKNKVQDATNQWGSGLIDGTFDQIKDMLSSDTKGLFESVIDSMNQNTFVELGSSIGSTLSDNILTSYKNSMADRFKNEIMGINEMMLNSMSSAENGTLSIMESAQISQRTQALAVQLESERQRMKAVESLFDYGRKINYDQTANQINYKTSSSKESVYNITNTNQFNVGTVVGKDYQMKEFANVLAPFIQKAFKNLGVSLS